MGAACGHDMGGARPGGVITRSIACVMRARGCVGVASVSSRSCLSCKQQLLVSDRNLLCLLCLKIPEAADATRLEVKGAPRERLGQERLGPRAHLTAQLRQERGGLQQRE